MNTEGSENLLWKIAVVTHLITYCNHPKVLAGRFQEKNDANSKIDDFPLVYREILPIRRVVFLRNQRHYHTRQHYNYRRNAQSHKKAVAEQLH